MLRVSAIVIGRSVNELWGLDTCRKYILSNIEKFDMASCFMFSFLNVFFFPPPTLPCFLSVCFSWTRHSAGMDASRTSSPPCHLYASLSPFLSLPPPTHQKMNCIPRNSSTKLSARSWTMLSTTWLQCNSCTHFACAPACPSSLTRLLSSIFTWSLHLWLCDLVPLIHQPYLPFLKLPAISVTQQDQWLLLLLLLREKVHCLWHVHTFAHCRKGCEHVLVHVVSSLVHK